MIQGKKEFFQELGLHRYGSEFFFLPALFIGPYLFNQCLDVLDGAHDIVHEHQGDQACLFSQSFTEILSLDESTRCIDGCDFPSQLFHQPDILRDGRVFNVADDHMWFLESPNQTVEDNGICFAGPAGEGDCLFGHGKKSAEVFPGLFELFLCLDPLSMKTAWVADVCTSYVLVHIKSGSAHDGCGSTVKIAYFLHIGIVG